jgi:serine/threonine protein kinase
MNHSALDLLQGELERLYDLDEMMQLSADLLGFPPAVVGGTGSKGAFARSLVGYCLNEDALAALVDAILLTSERADVGLRKALKASSNGELSPGTQVGSLRVVRKLAEGGLSIVYLAEAEGGGQAALKVIRTEYAKDRAAVHRFTTASRVMQSLRTPGLAPIFAVGQLDDARPWVAAELVRGTQLAERIRGSGPLHINDARPVFEGVLQGLIVLHRRGLTHGDVKVENVMVVNRSSESGVTELGGVLIDAGSERLLSRSEPRVDATSILPLIGTAKAMSPEQARGHEPDPRSDVYGMGTLMYETLTGRPPFIGESAIDVIAQQVAATPEPPSVYARRGWVSEALDELVLRALAKEPQERFQDATALLEALDHVARRPARRRPLDELAFTQARNVLLSNPANAAAADAVENQARDSGAYDRAATVFSDAARAARDPGDALSLLFRAARIYESDLKDPLRAEATFSQILQLDGGNQIALRGIESARRNAGDYTGLLEILLDRADREPDAEARRALWHEIAALYEEKLLDGNNAAVAWTQALVLDPSDARALRSIERLSSGHEARLNEVLETMASAAEESHAALFGDEVAARTRTAQELAQAKAELSQVQARVAELAESRAAERRALREQHDRQLAAAEAQVAQLQTELSTATASRDVRVQRVREAEETLREKRSEHESMAAHAETAVETFERSESHYGAARTQEQEQALALLAAQA